MYLDEVEREQVIQNTLRIEGLQTVELRRDIAAIDYPLGDEADVFLIIVPHKNLVGLDIPIVIDGQQIIPVGTQHVFHNVQKTACFIAAIIFEPLPYLYSAA